MIGQGFKNAIVIIGAIAIIAALGLSQRPCPQSSYGGNFEVSFGGCPR